ncbi:MAG: GHKL domain-containing protein [Rubrivivax sp.]|nr:GHKL domain-containing protein [Rubrivivax sp.]
MALLAARQPQGLAVAALNAPARTLWPHAGAGTALDSLAGLSAATRAALEALAPGQSTSFDGWRVAMLGGSAGGGEGAAGPAASPARYLLTPVAALAAEGDIFGSTLSHDLRAPIRVVEGFTRIVKEDYGARLDRIGNEHLDRVLGAAARMNLMIDALLTMARLSAQPLARQPVDLSQLAHHVLEDLRRSSAARNVEVEIEPGLRTSGDPTLLRLVLENLLGNAWKYTARTEGARIAMRSATHQGERAIAVSDNGAGFDMRSADRLFGLFQRLHSANDFPGHGVGLASVRRIVRRHGGDIWAEGRPGYGATFTFTLG